VKQELSQRETSSLEVSQWSYNPSRITRTDHFWRNISRHHASRSNNTAPANAHSFQDQAIHANENIVLDDDRSCSAIGRISLPILWVQRMEIRINYDAVGPDEYTVTDLYPLGRTYCTAGNTYSVANANDRKTNPRPIPIVLLRCR